MILKIFQKTITILLLAFFIIPVTVFAYSNRLIVGGENIGIVLNSEGVLVVGTYKIKGNSPASNAGLKNGDIITSVNDNDVKTIEDMAKKIDASRDSTIKITYMRNTKQQTTTLKLYKDEDNIYKTGLYVKDSITGIGTLTYIDPNTKSFGALGHEILEQSTGKILEIKDGNIFNTTVTGTIPSSDGVPGEKKAEYDITKIIGTVSENTPQGIFGIYTLDISNKRTHKVADPKDIKIGKATILTVLDGNTVKEYEIKIIKINNKNQKTKNFMFEIVDENLIKKTNGIIQGMSGSPIIQGDYIIGAVTHVVIDNPHKGYGIFITNMLEEADN